MEASGGRGQVPDLGTAPRIWRRPWPCNGSTTNELGTYAPPARGASREREPRLRPPLRRGEEAEEGWAPVPSSEMGEDENRRYLGTRERGQGPWQDRSETELSSEPAEAS
jgi:hypothetical protein